MNNEPNKTNSARESEVRAWVVRSPNDLTISGESVMLALSPLTRWTATSAASGSGVRRLRTALIAIQIKATATTIVKAVETHDPMSGRGQKIV